MLVWSNDRFIFFRRLLHVVPRGALPGGAGEPGVVVAVQAADAAAALAVVSAAEVVAADCCVVVVMAC